MAIRLRRIPGVGLIAICAARSVEKEGDVYLDDEVQMALARKFWQDYPQVDIEADAEVRAATATGESNNANRDDWDRTFGPQEETHP